MDIFDKRILDSCKFISDTVLQNTVSWTIWPAVKSKKKFKSKDSLYILVKPLTVKIVNKQQLCGNVNLISTGLKKFESAQL